MRPIYIKERAGIDLTDYDVAIILNSTNFNFSKAKADSSDIRFIDEYGRILNYWIEYWSASEEFAIVWVKVPRISAYQNICIYMLYGNPKATTESNGTKTFPFFDDFKGRLAPNWFFNSGQSGTGTYDFVDSWVRIRLSRVNDPWGLIHGLRLLFCIGKFLQVLRTIV